MCDMENDCWRMRLWLQKASGISRFFCVGPLRLDLGATLSGNAASWSPSPAWDQVDMEVDAELHHLVQQKTSYALTHTSYIYIHIYIQLYTHTHIQIQIQIQILQLHTIVHVQILSTYRHLIPFPQHQEPHSIRCVPEVPLLRVSLLVRWHPWQRAEPHGAARISESTE